MSQPLSGSSYGLDSTFFGKDEPFLYIFFDPGEATGIAIFDEEGEILESGQVSTVDELISWCADHRFSTVFKVVGYENFLLDPRTPQGGSNVPAAIAIGVIRSFAFDVGAEIATKKNGKIQTRLDKATGYAWWGKPVAKKSDPNNHEKDAIAHGVFWLVSRKIRKTNLERKKDGNH